MLINALIPYSVYFFTHFCLVCSKIIIIFEVIIKLKLGLTLDYRWTFKNEDDSTVHELAKQLKIPESLARVLTARDLTTAEEASNFFEPSLENLHDPFILRDMEKAVERILAAIDKGEQIWVHGDYDVDGTASVSLMCLFLREVGAKVDYYIPDRFEDGYGLSQKSINYAKQKDTKVLITVDVGITSFDALSYTQKAGIDTIICDHHEPGDRLPEVYAILDPLIPDCPYPFKPLAACGVAFKFIQGISQRLGKPEVAYKYLDFVAISSAADMVPLIGENRIMVYYGLKQLNETPRPGLKGLIYCTGLKLGNITASNIVYALAPLINAAGRLGDPRRSVEMMLQDDEFASFRIAQQLEDENRKRRLFDQQSFDEAIPIADAMIAEKDRRSLVIHGHEWHAGVIGIVASRLVDKYRLPTVLLTTIDGIAKGSARSINNFDIHAALKKCEHFLLEFGGHKHAAGLSLKIENIPAFREAFDEIAHMFISKEMLIPQIQIDAELKFNELSPQFLKLLSKFAPFGFVNNKPLFYSKGVRSTNGVKIVGTNSIKFRAIQNNFVIDAIAPNLANKINLCSGGKSFSIVYNLETHGFSGQKAPQLAIKDIRPDE